MFRMVNFWAVGLLFIVSACSSNTDCCSPPPDLNYKFAFTNQEGEDKLDPETVNSWAESDMTLYYLKGDTKSEVGNLDAMDVSYSEDAESYLLGVRVSSYVQESTTTTFLERPDGIVDTIKVKGVPMEEGSLHPRKMWYNGAILWKKGDHRFFEINISP